MTNFSLIITAGGTSSRYGSQNKLLELINGKSVIEHTFLAFADFNSISEIIIPTHSSIKVKLQEILDDRRIKFVNNGNTRQESVYNALEHVNNDYVIIHDGARPLIDKKVIDNIMESVIKYSAVTTMTKTVDTIKEVDENGFIIRTIDRTMLYNTQTPQAFKTEIIKKAHATFKGNSFTDDSSMVEELKIPVFMVSGNYTNIKITNKSDLDFAKLYI